MKKRIWISSLGFVLCLVMMLTCTLGIGDQELLASEKTKSPIVVKVKKTNIKADMAGNSDGLGSILLTNGKAKSLSAVKKYALVDEKGKFLFSYKKSSAKGNHYVYSDGIVLEVDSTQKYTSGTNIYNLNGKAPFKTPYTLSNYHFESEDDESLVSAERTLSFYYLTPFNDGVALARESLYVSLQWKGAGGGEEKVKYHLVSKEGKIVHTFSNKVTEDLNQAFHWTVIPGYNSYEWPAEGLLAVTVKGNYGRGAQKTYYMDYKENKRINLPGYIVGRAFTDGLAIVNDGKGNIGFINKKGKMVLNLKSYEEAYSFQNGLARVKKNGKYGCINTKGNVVIPCQYEDAFGSGEGLVSVAKNGKYGLVDYQNKVALPFVFDDISEFSHGVAYAVKNRTLYIITADTANYVKKNPLSKLGKVKNPLTVKNAIVVFKRNDLKKATFFKIGASKAKGKVTYTLSKKAKKAKIIVNKKGTVLIPKKCMKGTYTITVNAAGSRKYKPGKKMVIIRVK